MPAPYPARLASTIQMATGLEARPLTAPAPAADLGHALTHARGEVFIEVDPRAVPEMLQDASRGLAPYLWPAVIRVDEGGDVIVTATTGDRAQS